MLEKIIIKIANIINQYIGTDETNLLALGSMLSKQQYIFDSTNINDYEFKIFSQFGDDGIIQYLIKNIQIENQTFIEFGVEDYNESCTRFLMMNNNWTGFVMDGSKKNIDKLRKKRWLWKYDLTCKNAFIDIENINILLNKTNFINIGLLHIDIDGNEYHILQSLNLDILNPSIIIIEYNSVFGEERYITVPYRNDFDRTKAHYSNLYFGASISALNYMAEKKGYSLVACNLAGNNAYFVRNDLLNEKAVRLDVKKTFITSKFRESRDHNNSLSYLRGKQRIEIIKDLEVYNVLTKEMEIL